MKKIYSFMLLAAAMLLSISVSATVIPVSNSSDLQKIFDDATEGDILQLTEDVTFQGVTRGTKAKQPVWINTKGANIVLDLNGYTLSAQTGVKEMFYLYKGNLLVKNGTIQNAALTSGNPLLFKVFGTKDLVEAGNFTHLTIDESATLKVSGGNTSSKGYVISINERAAATVNGESLAKTLVEGSTSKGFANGALIEVYGDLEMMCAKGYCVKVNGNIRYALEYASELGLSTGVSADSLTAKKCAPTVKLYNTAHLTATAQANEVATIYSSGWAVFDIRCEAEGACALAIKSGLVTVTDAVLSSTSTLYNDPEKKGSGIDASGSAVLIESNDSYPGFINVTFAGDTRIEAVSGYAIEEAVPVGQDESLVSTVAIEGGTFIGGNQKPCIIVSQGTLSSPTATVTIGGGEYIDQTEADKEATNALITEIITGSNTYTTEVATAASVNTGVALVITSGTTPGVQLSDLTVEGLYGISSLNPDSSVNLSQVTDGTVFTLDDATGHGDLTLGDVIMNGNNLTIIVEDGITFTVHKLIMNDKARIIVKAGGKLIVTGEQGIIAPVVDNILVEAVEGNMGMFLFNPAVSSNKHPNGTVQLVSQGYREGSQYVWQRFGVPVYEGLLRTQIAKVGHEYGTGYMFWDFEKAGGPGWNDVALDQVMKPFEGFIMTTNTDHAGAKYAMSGALYGNVPAPLAYVPGWNYFANSYTAEIDIRALIDKYIESGSIEGAIQINTSSASNLWESIVLADLNFNEAAQTKLFPMQGFITKSKNDEIFKDTINYASMIWAHKDEANVSPAANSAPARRNMIAADYTNAVVVIAAAEGVQKVTLRQGEQFSNEFDNGYEASCYKNNLFNIYANSENGEMSQIATDNLMGQTLSIESAKAATFKMTFKNLRGETLAIRDNMTGSIINMAEGEEYFFSVAPGTTADRFEIVEAAKMPTDVEMLEAAPAKKGIYTLVGQYLGEDFEALPAGIYVVNGKKVVK